MDHHAVVYIGDSIDGCALPTAARTVSPDVVHLLTDRLSIDMVRTLRSDALVQPLSASVRTFVLVAREWPGEAQNALLKLLEEPPSSAEFILVVPRIDVLLPTVRSRILVATTPAKQSVDVLLPESFQSFLTTPYAGRLERVGEWAKDKAVSEMEELLRGAELYAHAHAVVAPQLLRTVVRVREHFGLSGAARKMLLEEIALSLPVV